MNLISNGSFEVNTTGWTAANSALAVDAGEYKVGAKSCKVTSSAAGDWGLAHYNAVTGTPVSRRAYTAACWVKGEGAAVGRTIRLTLRELGGAQSGGIFGLVDATLTDDWQRLVVTGTMVEADRTSVYVLPAARSAVGADEVFYLDDVQLEEVPSPLRAAIL